MTKLIASGLMLVFFIAACTSSAPPAARAKREEQAKNQAGDKRLLLELPIKRREIILRGMRKNSVLMTKIMEATIDRKFKKVEKLAEKMLFREEQMTHITHRGNPDFIELETKFHAVDAVELIKAARTKKVETTVRAAVNLMKTCNSCHAQYRLTEWPQNANYKTPKAIPIPFPKGFDKKKWVR